MANVVVVGAQWGDEGKGKVVDAFTAAADVVVRYSGGANAGHTLMLDDGELVTHLLPSGVVHPDKRCLLGAGMVIDPEGLLEEIQTCEGRGLSLGPDTLGVCQHAHVILSYHKELDSLRDRGKGAIGTTGRGIGPCYEDKMGRRGLQLWQLTSEARLRKALGKALPTINQQLVVLGGEAADLETLLARYLISGQRLAPYLCDTSRVIADEMAAGKAVLFEGAQGALLDIDYGTYPYVTSSNTVAGGACTGAGVGPTRIDAVVGIVKAYQTRVGNGPFPTELADDVGVLLQNQGREFGATTGRPRRCGWLDIAALRRAARVSGLTSLAVTKLDILKDITPLRLCTGYRLDGELLDEPPPGADAWERLEPVYEELPGFTEDIRGARHLSDLPTTARDYLTRIADLVGVPVGMVSVGPRRDETIMVEHPFGGGQQGAKASNDGGQGSPA